MNYGALTLKGFPEVPSLLLVRPDVAGEAAFLWRPHSARGAGSDFTRARERAPRGPTASENTERLKDEEMRSIFLLQEGKTLQFG